jgi:microcystin-dependent protein
MQGVAPTGAIMMYGAGTAPAGWLICDGSAVGRTQYPNLFNVISTQYGAGDGTSTFNLPNFTGRFAMGTSGTTYPLAHTGGEINHALTIAELARHSHPAIDPTHDHIVGAPQHTHNLICVVHNLAAGSDYNIWSIAGSGGSAFGNTTPGTNITILKGPTGVQVDLAGSSTPHNNLPPYLTVNYIIKV